MQSDESLLSRAMLRWSLTWRMQCLCKPNAERRELALNILLRYSLISQGKCGARTWLNVKIITNTYLIYKRWHKTKKITSTRQPSTLKISTKHSQHLKTFYTLKSLTFIPLIFIFHLHLWNTIFCLLFGIFRQIKRKNLWNRVIFRSSRLLIFNSEIVKTNSELVWISSKLVEISSELVSTRKGQKKWALGTGYGYRYT